MTDILLVKLESIGSETESRGLHPPFSILYLADVLEKAGFKPQLLHEEGTEANINKTGRTCPEGKTFVCGLFCGDGTSNNPQSSGFEGGQGEMQYPDIMGRSPAFSSPGSCS